MKKYFSIGEAAKAVHTTSETLRHYDRIGLVKPSKKDEWTNYRYYTEQDIVRLNTVRALQIMDLPLQEIKQVLEYDDLKKIIEFLEQADKKADEKIAALQYSKQKIQLAKARYERKLQGKQNLNGIFFEDFPNPVSYTHLRRGERFPSVYGRGPPEFPGMFWCRPIKTPANAFRRCEYPTEIPSGPSAGWLRLERARSRRAPKP